MYRFNQYQENCCSPAYTLSFDLKGNLTEAKSEYPTIDNGPVDPPKEEQIYDNKGRLVETISHKPDGSVLSKYVYSYDGRGNNTEISYYSGKGELFNKDILKHDEKDNLIEHTTYFKDGSPMYKFTYSNFDAHGNWLKRIHWDWETDGDKGAWEPFGVTYRTLTYYSAK